MPKFFFDEIPNVTKAKLHSRLYTCVGKVSKFYCYLWLYLQVIHCPDSLEELLHKSSDVLGINAMVMFTQHGGKVSDISLVR